MRLVWLTTLKREGGGLGGYQSFHGVCEIYTSDDCTELLLLHVVHHEQGHAVGVDQPAERPRPSAHWCWLVGWSLVVNWGALVVCWCAFGQGVGRLDGRFAHR